MPFEITWFNDDWMNLLKAIPDQLRDPGILTTIANSILASLQTMFSSFVCILSITETFWTWDP